MNSKEFKIATDLSEIAHDIGKLKGENKILKEQNEKLWQMIHSQKDSKES
jgi:hypothetical protein